MNSAPRLPCSGVATRLATLALCVSAAGAGAQSGSQLPFAPGETFQYTGRVHVGVSGRGTLRVDGPVDLRGTTTWTLHPEMEGKLGFLKATNKSESWIDPTSTSSRPTTRIRVGLRAASKCRATVMVVSSVSGSVRRY